MDDRVIELTRDEQRCVAWPEGGHQILRFTADGAYCPDCGRAFKFKNEGASA